MWVCGVCGCLATVQTGKQDEAVAAKHILLAQSCRVRIKLETVLCQGAGRQVLLAPTPLPFNASRACELVADGNSFHMPSRALHVDDQKSSDGSDSDRKTSLVEFHAT